MMAATGERVGAATHTVASVRWRTLATLPASAVEYPALARHQRALRPDSRSNEESYMFKIEVEDGKGRWSDVRGDDGNVLTFEAEYASRAALA